MNDLTINGTLVWYYFICKREVWLMAHNIIPDQDDPNIDLGRFIHENSYSREKKELSLGNVKLDILNKREGRLLIGEVKKSSKYLESAKMQLSYYLLELKRHGLEGTGILMFPKERKRIEIKLDDELIEKLEEIERDILRICYEPFPQKPKKINFCNKCGYREFCWA
ncbi:CRISPR-associated protein Cas4 [Clostridium sp. Cult2]|uniref:CRISPR-associated protein Cas4 n=1 Tax=Clostridium sp. Cult2 TaxID=2079003 RepID=UPI001F00039F|nr:CRISPR-associated protein Cas4 [Clostridium sp. Cult2]MCF6464457.1 CRISPR-associated protein Cas4 [Clostridium sp. Cult2]